MEKSAQFFYDQDVLDGKKGGHRGKRHHRDGHGGPQEKRKPREFQTLFLHNATLDKDPQDKIHFRSGGL